MAVSWSRARPNSQPEYPERGYAHARNVDLLHPGFLGMLFAFLPHERETGPHGHGLETITAGKAKG